MGIVDPRKVARAAARLMTLREGVRWRINRAYPHGEDDNQVLQDRMTLAEAYLDEHADDDLPTAVPER